MQVGDRMLIGNNTFKAPLNARYAANNAIAISGEFPWNWSSLSLCSCCYSVATDTGVAVDVIGDKWLSRVL